MSFVTDLSAQLETDIATALSLGAASVYTSKDPPQNVQSTEGEVAIVPVDSRGPGRGAGHATKLHTFVLRVRMKQVPEGARTGETSLTVVRDRSETLVERYAGARPFVVAMPTLAGLQADEDGDPFADDPKIAEARVNLLAVEF